MKKEEIASAFEDLQDRICFSLEKIDGKSLFKEDLWQRSEGGGGRTRVIDDGAIIEKGGVAFSAVHGPVNALMKGQLGLHGDSFFATGVSIVLHPNNPHVPIIHMNVRYFEMNNGEYWFGGGIDLTPHYIIPAHARLFHAGLKEVCDRYDIEFYSRFKAWADDYFYLSHRNETRGIGGIFFDHLKETSSVTKDRLFEFCISLGDKFVDLYGEQVDFGSSKAFSESEKKWMNLRRGRYVEFNLVHDRGTKFGLLSGGRTESILMSLPKNASWEYNYALDVDSKEFNTNALLRKGIDWLNE